MCGKNGEYLGEAETAEQEELHRVSGVFTGIGIIFSFFRKSSSLQN